MLRSGLANNATNKNKANVVTAKNTLHGKRKAESPQKKLEAKKRTAFGDLTNAVKKTAVGAFKGKAGLAGKPTLKKKQAEEAKKPLVLTRARSKSIAPEAKVEPVKVVQKEVLKPVEKNEIPRRKTRSMAGKEEETLKLDRASGTKRKSDGAMSTSSRMSICGIDAMDEPSMLYSTALGSPNTSHIEVLSEKSFLEGEEKKANLPEGVVDFDAETGDDPFQVGYYAQDIFSYYKYRESKFPIKNYLDKQRELNSNMRSILVDWMVEVQESFELNHETLYLAVKLVDMFLGKVLVKREKLQLVGTTALFIAAKYDERSPPAIDDFCYICDDAYPQTDVIKMEAKLLRSLDFDIGIPLSYRFLRRYARVAKLEMETLTLARFILETSLMEYEFIDTRDSMIAGASLLLALKMKDSENTWSPTLAYYSGFSVQDLFDLTHRLYKMLQNSQPHLKTIRSKYEHKVFYEVAKFPLPDELIL